MVYSKRIKLIIVPGVVDWDEDEAGTAQLLEVGWQESLHLLQIAAILTLTAQLKKRALVIIPVIDCNNNY